MRQSRTCKGRRGTRGQHDRRRTDLDRGPRRLMVLHHDRGGGSSYGWGVRRTRSNGSRRWLDGSSRSWRTRSSGVETSRSGYVGTRHVGLVPLHPVHWILVMARTGAVDVHPLSSRLIPTVHVRPEPLHPDRSSSLMSFPAFHVPPRAYTVHLRTVVASHPRLEPASVRLVSSLDHRQARHLRARARADVSGEAVRARG